jgi:hypothetical protein
MLRKSNKWIRPPGAYPAAMQSLDDTMTSQAFRDKWGANAITLFRQQLKGPRFGRPCDEFLQHLQREAQRMS